MAATFIWVLVCPIDLCTGKKLYAVDEDVTEVV